MKTYSYLVLSPGYANGQLYSPNGKRNKLHTTKQFPKKNGVEQVPSWLKPIKAETAEEREQREQKEQDGQTQSQQQQEEINTFLTGQSDSTVETL